MGIGIFELARGLTRRQTLTAGVGDTETASPLGCQTALVHSFAPAVANAGVTIERSGHGICLAGAEVAHGQRMLRGPSLRRAEDPDGAPQAPSNLSLFCALFSHPLAWSSAGSRRRVLLPFETPGDSHRRACRLPDAQEHARSLNNFSSNLRDLTGSAVGIK